MWATLRNRYSVSQTQVNYADVKTQSRNVSATGLHKTSGEGVYENIENKGASDAYSTAVSMQDIPAYEVTETQPSNNSMYF